MTVPSTNTPVASPAPNPVRSDVLHNEQHSRLSVQEIAKAVARHKREHPTQTVAPLAAKGRPIPQKTTPRG